MKITKIKTITKPYREMNTEELARATAEFEEFVIDQPNPLTPEKRREWQRIRRGLGRSKKGPGAKVISLSVERCLLARSDRLAKKLGITRAALIARGLERMLESEKSSRRKTGT